MRNRIWSIFIPILVFFLAAGVIRLASPAKVVLSWETASEVNTAGFLVFRSTSSEEDFVQLNQDLIPAQGDPLIGADYEYLDTEVSWGQMYSYQLEEVELSGGHTRYPESVQSRAGLGWVWTIIIGLGLSILTSIGLKMWAAPKREQTA